MRKVVLISLMLLLVPAAVWSVETERFEIKVVKLPYATQTDDTKIHERTVVFDRKTGKLWVVLYNESTGSAPWNIVPLEYTSYFAGYDYLPPKIPVRKKKKKKNQ
ncbi:MAG: hypothetical protein GY866_17075 [Proteobacteria bacterium]|nr:hypothetical protein [Pseudomonadota bacterium]